MVVFSLWQFSVTSLVFLLPNNIPMDFGAANLSLNVVVSLSWGSRHDCKPGYTMVDMAKMLKIVRKGSFEVKGLR